MYRSILKKDLKRKKTMNMILFIFIILAAMFVASSVNNLASVVTALDSYFDKADIPDQWITVPNETEHEKFTEFADQKGYDCKTLEMITIDPNDILHNGEKLGYDSTICISSLKNSTKVFDKNDREITEVKDGEIYLTALIFYNKKYDLEVGDTITISLNGKTKEFTLKGCTKDACFGSGMIGMTRMLVSENDFDYFNGEDATMMYSEYVYTDDADFMDEFNHAEISSLFNADRSMMNMTYIMDMLIAAVILVVSMCLILISMLILRFTINFTMSEEFREIGVMKAIGIEVRRIRGIYITKYFAISVVGSTIGFALSIPFGKMLLRNVSKNIIIGSTGGIWLNLVCAAATAAVVVLFCYLCTRKIKKFSPIDAIRNGENGERYTRKGVVHLSRSRISPVFFMAVNDILSGLKRFAAMIIIFTLGLLLITIPENTINTMQSDNTIYWFNMTECDHVLSTELLFDQSSSRKKLEDRLASVKNYLAENDIEADVFQEAIFRMNISHNDKKTTSVAFQGIGDVTADQYMYEEGGAPQNAGEVAITGLIAEQIDVNIGDDVEIKNGESTKTYTVCGLYQSMTNMGEGIRFYQDEDLDYNYVGGAFGMQIRYKDAPDGKTLSERKAMLAEHYPDWTAYTAGEYIRYMVGDVSGQLDSVKLMIIIVVLSINILVMVLMVKSFLTKEKGEIATLKAIGFRTGSLVAWQTIRIAIVLLISAVLASALSTPLSHLIVGPIFRMMGAQSIEFEIRPLKIFLLYPLLIFSVTTLSGMLTALQLRKIKASETSNIE